uniref:Transcription factor Dp-1 n=1 Tax=Panagrolaimus sp. ES5 TaxID=591445 RepID=A0AC34F8Q0_9BILA
MRYTTMAESQSFEHLPPSTSSSFGSGEHLTASETGTDDSPILSIRRPYSFSAPSAGPVRRVIIPKRSYSFPIPSSSSSSAAAPSSSSRSTRIYQHAQSSVNAANRLEYINEKDGVKNSLNGLPPITPLYRTNDKSRGLRYFSSKVCEKVREKGRTNYNEVADELVADFFDAYETPPQSFEKQQYDMKNIRRRIYDAINVLTAMNIIEKEKKEIRWIGLPTSSDQECKKFEEEKELRQESIRKKTEQLQELVIQLVAFKSLVQRNRENEKANGRPEESKLLYLPFVAVSTNPDTIIDCSIAKDKTEFLFKLNQPFELFDDIEILKRHGLAHGLEKANVTQEFRQYIKDCLPPALQNYADEIMDGNLTANLPPPLLKEEDSPPTLQAYQRQRPSIVRRGNGNPSGIRTLVPTLGSSKSAAYQSRDSYHSILPSSSSSSGPYTIPPSSASYYRNFDHRKQYFTLSSNQYTPGQQQRYIQVTPSRLQTSYSPNMHHFASSAPVKMPIDFPYEDEVEELFKE